MCFEILGMDVMIDHKLKVWLFEVNHTPSFSTDTPFDFKIKNRCAINCFLLQGYDTA